MEIINKPPNKSRDSDTLSNCLLKKCLDLHLSLISAIINRSRIESVKPSGLKQVTITPLLKRSGLEREDRKNYPERFLHLKLVGETMSRRREEQLEVNDLHTHISLLIVKFIQ